MLTSHIVRYSYFVWQQQRHKKRERFYYGCACNTKYLLISPIPPMVRMTVEWGENWDLSSISAVDRQIMEVSIDSSLKTQLSASGKSDLTIDDRILLPMDGGASTTVSSLLWPMLLNFPIDLGCNWRVAKGTFPPAEWGSAFPICRYFLWPFL